MNEILFYELLKDNIGIQDEALRKLVWVLYKNFDLKMNFKQNILLIGERGSGKTTMLKEITELMDIPLGEIYNLFSPNGINSRLFLSGIYKMMMNGDGTDRGVLLLHDFQDCFLYGHSMWFNSMLASGIIDLGDEGYYDISSITFVGEIDINNVRDIFMSSMDDLSDLDSDNFVSPTLNMVKKYLTKANEVHIDSSGNKSVNVGFEKYMADQIKYRFLSSTCEEVFKTKIYMDDMDTDNIIRAINSPLSVLNLYRNDLTEEYINSDSFIKKIAYYVLESGEGLHSASRVIEEVVSRDYQNNEKVLKKGSLLVSHKN